MSSNDASVDRLCAAWRAQPAPMLSLTPEQLAAQHAKLRVSLRRSLIVEYVACAFVLGWVALRWWYVPGGWLTKAQYVATIAAVLFVAHGLRKHLTGYGAPPAGADLLSFQRASLERLRRSFLAAWRWYLLPFAPTVVLAGIDRWFFHHHPLRSIEVDHLHILGGMAIAAAIAGAVALWHRIAARRLQRAIDYLDNFGGHRG